MSAPMRRTCAVAFTVCPVFQRFASSFNISGSYDEVVEHTLILSHPMRLA